MLQFMRRLAHAWLFKALMIILVISFGIWGIGDIFRGNPLQRVAATAGSASISIQDLSREFQRNLLQARRNFGPDMTAQQAKAMGFVDLTLSNMIDKSLLDQSARGMKIDIANTTMGDILASVPQFHDKEGKFDKDLVRQLLERANVSEKDFFAEQRNESSRQLVLLSFENKIPQPPSTMVNALAAARGQKRILDILTLENNSIDKVKAPTEKDLNDFYDKHGKEFTAPEYRGLTLAVLTIESIAKDVAISDDNLRKEYEARSSLLEKPELRTVTQVVLQEEDKAQKLATKARASGDLSRTAKTDGYEAIPLEDTDKRSLMTELADPVFSMNKGDISAPIKTSLGWHVMQLQTIKPAGKPSFESVKEELRASLGHNEAIETVTRMVNKLDDELAAGHPLEDIADEMKMRVIKIPAISAVGKTPDGKPPAELPNAADTLKTAFGLNNGEVSPVMDDKNGSYIVVRTDDITPSAIKPFDTVKQDVIAAWRAEEQDAVARTEAEKIAQGLRGGKPMSQFAGRVGVETHQSKPISQVGDNDPELPPVLLPNILKMKKGEVLTWPLPGKQMVLRVASVTNIDVNRDNIATGRITGELNEDMPRELANSYLKHLRNAYPVAIHQDIVDSVVQAPTGN
jgi:peptidyl-prolyl cis-trans isomerase D